MTSLDRMGGSDARGVEDRSFPRSEVPIRELLPPDNLPIGMGMTGPATNVLVQKYGGSSVADPAGIKRAAQRIYDAQASGYQVVAVVSAMGDTTDELLDLAASISPHPRARELDTLMTTGELVSAALLAIALADLGADVRTFTGTEAGLITDDRHGKARITDVKPRRIQACLERGQIAVVAGFQGISGNEGVVTTLGRGGSDLTAVALAAALGCVCEIYTDVDGIYTADPRIVPRARKLDVLSSEEMLELAASGAKVLHLRCIEYARRFGVPIHVRSSFVQKRGTMIMPNVHRQAVDAKPGERTLISGVESSNSAARITVAGVPDCSQTIGQVLMDLAASGVHVEMVARHPRATEANLADVTLTLPAAELRAAIAALAADRNRIGFEALQHNDEMGRVWLNGLGMRSCPDPFHTFFKALNHAGISVELVSMSELSIAAAVPAEQLTEAVNALKAAFDLTPPEQVPETRDASARVRAAVLG